MIGIPENAMNANRKAINKDINKKEASANLIG